MVNAGKEPNEAELKKSLAALALLAVLGAAVFYARKLNSPSEFTFDTPYQAVLLDNGQLLYGKMARPNGDFLAVTDVFYIQQQANTETKEVKSVLVRRGTEWHGPNRTILNKRHVIMIENVTAGSKVAELIAELRTKGQ